MAQAGMTVMREVPYVGTYPHNPGGPQQDVKHRIDIHVLLPSGERVVIDTTVRLPLHPEAHKKRGVTAEAAHTEKVTWITKRYKIPKATVKPFAIETYGAMSETAKDLVRLTAKYKAGDDTIMYAQLVSQYRSRIAVAVQRGNHIAIHRWLARRTHAAPALGPAVGGAW